MPLPAPLPYPGQSRSDKRLPGFTSGAAAHADQPCDKELASYLSW